MSRVNFCHGWKRDSWACCGTVAIRQTPAELAVKICSDSHAIYGQVIADMLGCMNLRSLYSSERTFYGRADFVSYVPSEDVGLPVSVSSSPRSLHSETTNTGCRL
jgi:hypothetical protein